MILRGMLWAVLGAATFASASAVAQDWQQFVFVSDTLTVSASRLCMGAPTTGRLSDIGCPSYAPSLTTAGDVSVTGNLSAAQFIGDGSLLTGVGSGDRITSGTTNIIANTNGAISFTTAGTQRMVIDSSGNVGIGTTAPIPGHKLEIRTTTNGGIGLDGIGVNAVVDFANSGTLKWAQYNNASDNSYNIYNYSNSTNAMTILGSGNVGIGTTGPEAKLHVSGGELLLDNTYAVASKDVGGTARGLLWVDASDIVHLQNNTGANGGVIAFHSLTGAGESMRIDSSGNVGIGTANPAAKLHVNVGTDQNIGFSSASSQARISAFNDAANANVPLRLQASEYHFIGLNALSEPMTINASGNVGIGTTAPSVALEVSGTVSATRYVGDGSGLTGVAAASSDRIVSGTNNATSMVAISASGYISVTQAGANSAWFDPARGLVTLGVSSTGGISGSTGYFYGNVGIGTTAPAGLLTVAGAVGNGQIQIKSTAGTGASSVGLLAFTDSADARQAYVYKEATSGDFVVANESTLGSSNKIRFVTGGNTRLTIEPTNGNVGIGTTSPASLLDVRASGAYPTVKVGETGQNRNIEMTWDVSAQHGYISTNSLAYPIVYRASTHAFTSGNVGIGTTTPSATVDISGTLRVADSNTGTGTCSGGSSVGTIRVNPTTKELELCRE